MSNRSWRAVRPTPCPAPECPPSRGGVLGTRGGSAGSRAARRTGRRAGHRPHTGIGGHTPASRVTNLSGQHT
ncbi:hypothetical protein E5082_30540 [Streptomyces griseoluteus]|uniref:Uncharacterized protein n=1 Tax=Streptomyces griseoluteus TaxID=29306 RepID=A0A4Z1CZ97_STRGP|nr:hypothetical protein E5082_30540 [Streptomyces griseoluteus]